MIPCEQFKYGYEIVRHLPRRMAVMEMVYFNNFKNIPAPTTSEILLAVKIAPDVRVLEKYVDENNVDAITAKACKQKHTEFVKKLVEDFGAFNMNRFFRVSCGTGNMELVKYFNSRGAINYDPGLRKALLKENTDEVIMFLTDKLPPGKIYKAGFNFNWTSKAISEYIMEKFGIFCKRSKPTPDYTTSFIDALKSCDYRQIDIAFSIYKKQELFFHAMPHNLEFMQYAEKKYGAIFSNMTILKATCFSQKALTDSDINKTYLTGFINSALGDEVYDYLIKTDDTFNPKDYYLFKTFHQITDYYKRSANIEFCMRSAVRNDNLWFVKYVIESVQDPELYLYSAITNEHTHIARFIIEKIPRTAECALGYAISNNYLYFAKFIVDKFGFDCSEEFRQYCLGDEFYLEMILFLKKHSKNLKPARQIAKKMNIAIIWLNIKD